MKNCPWTFWWFKEVPPMALWPWTSLGLANERRTVHLMNSLLQVVPQRLFGAFEGLLATVKRYEYRFLIPY